MVDVRPEDVLEYKAPTEGFLCPLEANVWDIEFLAFKIRDAESGKVKLPLFQYLPPGTTNNFLSRHLGRGGAARGGQWGQRARPVGAVGAPASLFASWRGGACCYADMDASPGWLLFRLSRRCISKWPSRSRTALVRPSLVHARALWTTLPTLAAD